MAYEAAAAVYDLIYDGEAKDYAGEAAVAHGTVQRLRPGSGTLLDVACGTGRHLQHLRKWYSVEGVDVSPAMLEVARRALAGVPLHVGDMRTLDLGRRFDAITCLFSAVGYLESNDALRGTARRFAAHLNSGGVLIVDGWIRPESWRDGLPIDSDGGQDGTRTVVRMGMSTRSGRKTTLDYHILVGDHTRGIEHITERHELTLFTTDEYRDALSDAGFAVTLAEDGPYPDRDRLIGVLT